MYLKKISNYLNSKEYNINISNNTLYINNYTKIDNITDNEISLYIDKIFVITKGKNMKIEKMLDNEILIHGKIERISLNYND